MIFYKNVRMKRVKGGYIVECDKYIQSKDAYDGMRYISQKEEIFESGESALEKLNELHLKEQIADKKMMKMKVKKHSEETNDEY